jgi:hypothetical protein
MTHPTPAHSLLPRWRLLPRADQERVIDLIEDDREDEVAEVLGMKRITGASEPSLHTLGAADHHTAFQPPPAAATKVRA